MAVFKIEKTNNYTVMSNYHLKDKNLTYKAKGLLSFMLSLPDDWDYSTNGLVAISKEGRDGIRAILKELQEHHYLKIEKVRDKKGCFEYNYLIYEIPYMIEPDYSKIYPDTENPPLDNPSMEKTTQINTNITNTNNKDKYDKPENLIVNKLIHKRFIEVKDFNIEKYCLLLKETLKDYDYCDVIKVCSYIADKWEENNGIDENNNYIINKFAYFRTSLLNNLIKISTNVELWDDD